MVNYSYWKAIYSSCDLYRTFPSQTLVSLNVKLNKNVKGSRLGCGLSCDSRALLKTESVHHFLWGALAGLFADFLQIWHKFDTNMIHETTNSTFFMSTLLQSWCGHKINANKHNIHFGTGDKGKRMNHCGENYDQSFRAPLHKWSQPSLWGLTETAGVSNLESECFTNASSSIWLHTKEIY